MSLWKEVYPLCYKHAGKCAWQNIIASCEDGQDPSVLPDLISQKTDCLDLPAYLSDLARLEKILWRVRIKAVVIPETVDRIMVNPCLELLKLSWKLLANVSQDVQDGVDEPRPGDEMILAWRDPDQEMVHIQQATSQDLLALKIIAELIDFKEAAEANQVSLGVIDHVINKAVQKGILLAPSSRLRRDVSIFSESVPEEFISSPTFSIQWHITNACDLSCKHCYDRSKRSALHFDDALSILDDLYDFCKERFVRGHVSFTGGNPFLYSRFKDLYREASERGFALSILGNPVAREKIEEIKSIQQPRFFQVSLEGLKEHNDEIRGAGHYERVIEFLDLLNELGISSSVMLTLTRDNLAQILPLAGQLQNLTDSFTFNRLSQVGEGAQLELPDKEAFRNFLVDYTRASKQNTILHYKDNLFNLLRYQNGKDLFDGCTGYGCGAAFNFIAVLPDGEAHACRKFPSPIGNVFQQKIADIYDSPTAQKYRIGCRACDGCDIRHVCGGCMAISHGFGQDVFSQKDPYCFKSLIK